MFTVPGQICILKIEIDGHFHGGEPVKPWVAAIGGPCPRYGLVRDFVAPMNDWSQARRAWSGNIYGRVAHFALRDGGLYEVQRCRGNSSKRRVVREFVVVRDGKRERITPEEALARADGGGPAVLYRIPEDRDGTSWVARVRGLGTPERLGFVAVQDERLYRLQDGVYEVVTPVRRRLVLAQSDAVSSLSEQEAWQWLTASARSA